MVELGKININMKISMLASNLEFPREGHLEAVLYVFLYLQKNHNSRLDLDTTYTEIDHVSFKKHKWVEFYCDMKESIPTDMPDPREKVWT